MDKRETNPGPETKKTAGGKITISCTDCPSVVGLRIIIFSPLFSVIKFS